MMNVMYELLYIQEDVFQSVGVPLVRNALAGYNTTILSYGQVHYYILMLTIFFMFLVTICVTLLMEY